MCCYTGENVGLRNTCATHCNNVDCLQWLANEPEASYEAIVTDPPYGLKEYTDKEQSKLRDGNRGRIRRIPPSLGGNIHAPLPGFTVLTSQDIAELHKFFCQWGKLALNEKLKQSKRTASGLTRGELRKIDAELREGR